VEDAHAVTSTTAPSRGRRVALLGLAILHGPPPNVVWLRLRNVATVDIATVILDHNETIEQFATDEDEALLVLSAI